MTTDENVKWAGREKRLFKLISQVREEEDFLADFVGANVQVTKDPDSREYVFSIEIKTAEPTTAPVEKESPAESEAPKPAQARRKTKAN